jgi:hypothetical protein
MEAELYLRSCCSRPVCPLVLRPPGRLHQRLSPAEVKLLKLKNYLRGEKVFLVLYYFNGMLILWRACNLTSFSPCLTGPVDYLFASCHKGPRFKSPGGYLCETGILLLAMSRYNLEIPGERESFISGRGGQGGGNMQHSQPYFLHL